MSADIVKHLENGWRGLQQQLSVTSLTQWWHRSTAGDYILRPLLMKKPLHLSATVAMTY